MKISEVKTAFKIADVEFVKGSTKLNFNYLQDLRDENGAPLPQKILRENVARVYLIVVNGEIKKIGGSQADGGIKATLQIYQDGGVGGRPSIRSFGVWYFLYHTILTGAKNRVLHDLPAKFWQENQGVIRRKARAQRVYFV